MFIFYILLWEKLTKSDKQRFGPLIALTINNVLIALTNIKNV